MEKQGRGTSKTSDTFRRARGYMQQRRPPILSYGHARELAEGAAGARYENRLKFRKLTQLLPSGQRSRRHRNGRRRSGPTARTLRHSFAHVPQRQKRRGPMSLPKVLPPFTQVDFRRCTRHVLRFPSTGRLSISRRQPPQELPRTSRKLKARFDTHYLRRRHHRL